MNTKIVLITDQELKTAISLTEYMKQAWQATHGALDKLIVMDSYIRKARREAKIDYEPDEMDGIEIMRNQAYKLVGEAQSIYNDVIRNMEKANHESS